ncbi:hypothetical protein EVAR_78128_1 [Eumeta japonica]|uniref:Endonuclease-reverse transcriptase n=1 Tax=Eumeta variegata TaxID=151549 RepID=A0A4C1T1F7_EUMVA|nr:hypothetical protein EVAR_78128_1 [Eumeta japonica]
MERSMLKIRRIQKIKSEHIRQKTKLADALRHALSLKWRWVGHISRYTDRRWTIEATRWKGPIGKRNVGRQLRRWADDIKTRRRKRLDKVRQGQGVMEKDGGGLYPNRGPNLINNTNIN